jgi:hypothetical protein
MPFTLSVNVPTYNRHSAFYGFVDHFAEAVANCSPSMLNGISINVIDNYSTDIHLKASYFFARLASFNIQKQFFKQESNVGGDRNIIAAYGMSVQSEFTMVAGDDDYLSPDALQLSLELIRAYGDRTSIFLHTRNAHATVYSSLCSLIRDLGEAGKLFDVIEMCHITNPIFRQHLFSQSAARQDIDRSEYLATHACFSHARGLLHGYLRGNNSSIVIIPFERFSSPNGLRDIDPEVAAAPASLGSRIYGIYRSFIFWLLSETRISLKECLTYCQLDQRMHWIFSSVSTEY